MILVDTSVWVDHLHHAEAELQDLLEARAVLMHPFVVGELVMGNLPRRSETRADLMEITPSPVADHAELLHFIEAAKLYGSGLSYVDIHVLASVRLTPGASLWARDRRLNDAAAGLGLPHRRPH